MRKFALSFTVLLTLIAISCSSTDPRPLQTVLVTVMVTQPPQVVTATAQLPEDTPTPTELPVLSPTETDAPTSTPGPYLCAALDAINWEDAKTHQGQTITVFGEVVDTFYASSSNGQPTFLNLGKPYPDPGRFTVLIWGRDRGNFQPNPEELYLGQFVCVTGVIELYEGIAEIEINDPSQILIPQN